MADSPATTQETLTNRAEGPRFFYAADGSQVVLRSGESWTGELHQAELDTISSDFDRGAVQEADGGAAAGPGPVVDRQSYGSYPKLDGLNRDQLIAVARQEGYRTIADQPELSEDDIRAAIETARRSTAADLEAEAAKLAKDNSRDELVAMAGEAGITDLAGDAVKIDIARRIVQARSVSE